MSDWVFSMQYGTISDGKMADHSAGHISTEEGGKLIADVGSSSATKASIFTRRKL